jgi:hypothetical protein
MEATRARLSSPRASACGIAASTPLSVLGRDRAYSYLDACPVHRVPFNDPEGFFGRLGVWPHGLFFVLEN